MIANADLIIDALLGTGTKLTIKGEMLKILQRIHQALDDREADRSHIGFSTPGHPTADTHRKPIIIAVDIPTGLNSDTGELDNYALYADETVTFEAVKPGHVTFSGADAVGLLHSAPLHFPEKLKPRDSIKTQILSAPPLRPPLPQRPPTATKANFA